MTRWSALAFYPALNMSAGMLLGWLAATGRTRLRLLGKNQSTARFEVSLQRYTAMVRLDERSRCVRELEELGLFEDSRELKSGAPAPKPGALNPE